MTRPSFPHVCVAVLTLALSAVGCAETSDDPRGSEQGQLSAAPSNQPACCDPHPTTPIPEGCEAWANDTGEVISFEVPEAADAPFPTDANLGEADFIWKRGPGQAAPHDMSVELVDPTGGPNVPLFQVYAPNENPTAWLGAGVSRSLTEGNKNVIQVVRTRTEIFAQLVVYDPQSNGYQVFQGERIPMRAGTVRIQIKRPKAGGAWRTPIELQPVKIREGARV
jgi:hypothetical protein